MTTETQELNKREIGWELREVRAAHKDEIFKHEERRDTLIQQLVQAELKLTAIAKVVSTQSITLGELKAHVKFVERQSLKDRQSVVDLHKILKVQKTTTDAAIELCSKIKTKFREANLNNQRARIITQGLKRQIKEMQRDNKEIEETSGEPDQDRNAITRDAGDIASNS